MLPPNIHRGAFLHLVLEILRFGIAIMSLENVKTLAPSIVLAVSAFILACSPPAHAQSDLRIKDICRLKGQEENTLQGMGLVVGLKGTGDGSVSPTIRALTRTVQQMGGSVGTDIQGRLLEKELANSKNVALVFVEVTIPTTGAQQGDKLNCSINAINAKSLEGGSLMLTHLLGPRADQPIVFGLASGPITLDDPKTPTSGKVVDGCKMEMNVVNEFVANNKVTLIVNPDHRSIETSQTIQDVINDFHKKGIASSIRSGSENSPGLNLDIRDLAKAVDQTAVVVNIPPAYKDQPVAFASLILDLPLLSLHNRKTVYIQEREKVIVIGEDVTIAPVVISHKNLTVSAQGTQKADGKFVSIGTQEKSKDRPTLKNLNEALNALNVPTADVIAIIKALKRQGNLYGELIIE